jgi:type VI protein secretion system component VasF
LTLSFNEYEAEQSRLSSLKDTQIAELRADIAELKVDNKAVAGQRNVAVVAVAALALVVVGYIGFKVLRFLKIIPL